MAGALRIEEDSLVATPAGVRSSLFLDRGPGAAGRKTTVLVGEKRLEVRAGRAWIDARGGDGSRSSPARARSASAPRGGPVGQPDRGRRGDLLLGRAGDLESRHAGRAPGIRPVVAVERRRSARDGAGAVGRLDLAWPSRDRCVRWKRQALVSSPRVVPATWARRAPADRASARRARAHRARHGGDRGRADLLQPAPEMLEGQYSVRLPERAILQEFAVGQGRLDAAGWIGGGERSRRDKSAYDSFSAQLEWAGAGRYRGIVRDIRPGKTKVVRLRYAEWLSHYQVKGSGGEPSHLCSTRWGRAAALTGNAPNLGEFSLEVDVSRADIGGCQRASAPRTRAAASSCGAATFVRRPTSSSI